MQWAGFYGNSSCQKVLLDTKANIEATNNNGNTALMMAAERSYPESVKILLAAKANIEAKNNHGNNALMVAAHRDHPECARLLLDAKADVEVTKVDGENAPMCLSRGGQRLYYLW